LLTQVTSRGTAINATKLRHPVAGKTGTTNDSFDAWFVGYTPTLVTTVWVGYDTYEYPMATGEQGGRTSLPIWLDFMTAALDGKVERDWDPPAGVCLARVDERTGKRVHDDRKGSFVAPFRCGKEPDGESHGGGISLDEAQRRGGI
jgi:penicillin-binding protein 1A